MPLDTLVGMDISEIVGWISPYGEYYNVRDYSHIRFIRCMTEITKEVEINDGKVYGMAFRLGWLRIKQLELVEKSDRVLEVMGSGVE